jgi:hypothetical protein
VAPVRTPDETAERVDFLVEGLRQSLWDRENILLPALPATAAGVLAGTVGSDGLTRVLVDCSDATSGVARAHFALDGKVRRVDRTVPFAWDADLRGLPLGEHTLEGVVFDEAGLSTSVAIRVVVVPTTQDGVLNTLHYGPNLGGI